LGSNTPSFGDVSFIPPEAKDPIFSSKVIFPLLQNGQNHIVALMAMG
jgi:hypothetical protein